MVLLLKAAKSSCGDGPDGCENRVGLMLFCYLLINSLLY